MLRSIVFFCLPTLWSCAIYAADISRGRMLYENHCGMCHTSVVHVRDTHVSKSISEINRQVNRWQSELKLGWDKGEIDDVVQYLNVQFYQY